MQIPIQKTSVDSRAKKTDAKKLKGSLKNTILLNNKHWIQEIHFSQTIYYYLDLLVITGLHTLACHALSNLVLQDQELHPFPEVYFSALILISKIKVGGLSIIVGLNQDPHSATTPVLKEPEILRTLSETVHWAEVLHSHSCVRQINHQRKQFHFNVLFPLLPWNFKWVFTLQYTLHFPLNQRIHMLISSGFRSLPNVSLESC